MSLHSLEPIVNLTKRKGFVVQSSEIYGGVASLFDYGPLGVELRNNIKQFWWKTFVHGRDDMVGIESSIIMHPRVWDASGHTETFTDPLVECTKCHFRFREDHVPTKEHNPKFWKCPEGADHTFAEPRQFNLMLKTYLGATEESASAAYLRPETAQGMFVDFKYVTETSRTKIPFGIAQIGKTFRNEIGLGNWLFRLREFEIAELEYFVKPGTDEEHFMAWVERWEAFYEACGIPREHIRRDVKAKEDLAHYSKGTIDFEYKFPFGWDELGAVANRTDYDLKRHAEYSGKDLSFFDPETKEKFVPYVIEPTQGIDRLFVAILCESYKEYPNGRKGEEGETLAEPEVVLHLPPIFAPYKVAVLPLVKKDGLAEKAKELAADLRKHVTTYYDESGSIGRRYRRQDEVGTPWCVTVDHQTLEDGTVTLRDRDTMEQERIKLDELSQLIYFKLNG
ncbi:MAG TPA: glycine--tRNA ligase [Patescibacteria group bacterium]